MVTSFDQAMREARARHAAVAAPAVALLLSVPPACRVAPLPAAFVRLA